MTKYINAVEAAEKIATACKIPMGDLVDVFAGIPAADAAPVRYATLYLNKHYGDYECSACGKGDIIRISSRNSMMGYCPYCGAKFTDHIGFDGGAGA